MNNVDISGNKMYVTKCVQCNDEYVGDSDCWGVKINAGRVCFYCYYDMSDRKFSLDWEK